MCSNLAAAWRGRACSVTDLDIFTKPTVSNPRSQCMVRRWPGEQAARACRELLRRKYGCCWSTNAKACSSARVSATPMKGKKRKKWKQKERKGKRKKKEKKRKRKRKRKGKEMTNKCQQAFQVRICKYYLHHRGDTIRAGRDGVQIAEVWLGIQRK